MVSLGHDWVVLAQLEEAASLVASTRRNQLLLDRTSLLLADQWMSGVRGRLSRVSHPSRGLQSWNQAAAAMLSTRGQLEPGDGQTQENKEKGPLMSYSGGKRDVGISPAGRVGRKLRMEAAQCLDF